MCGLIEQRGETVLHVLADPHARFFYEKMGCLYQTQWPSSIPGRTLPYLIYNPELQTE
jgi:hypothetical protein